MYDHLGCHMLYHYYSILLKDILNLGQRGWVISEYRVLGLISVQLLLLTPVIGYLGLSHSYDNVMCDHVYQRLHAKEGYCL